jgi:hypothetical protein
MSERTSDLLEAEIKSIPSRDAASLERLQKLVEIGQKVQQTPRWPTMALFLIVLGGSALLLTPVNEIEIEMDLTVSKLSFETAAGRSFARDMRLGSLGIAPGQLTDLLQTCKLPYDASHVSGVRMEVMEGGTLGLRSLALSPGLAVVIEETSVPAQYLVNLRKSREPGSAGELKVGGKGPWIVTLTPSGRADCGNEVNAETFRLSPTGETKLTLGLLPGSVVHALAQMPVTNLGFERSIEDHVIDQTYPNLESTIEGGKIYLSEYAGRELPVRPGEPLQFDSVRGRIRHLTLGASMELSFHGFARGMRLGHNRKSMMPAVLEYLQAQQGIRLDWALALSAFGLGVSALRFLRRRD